MGLPLRVATVVSGVFCGNIFLTSHEELASLELITSSLEGGGDG